MLPQKKFTSRRIYMDVQYTYPSSDLVHACSTNYCQVKPAGIG